jgi:hypothetical protein
MPYLAHHKLNVTVFLIALAAVSYGLSRVLLKRRVHPEQSR